MIGKISKTLILVITLFVLCGCQELQGPVWSNDGRRVAYTLYTQGAANFLDTSIYTVEADDDAAEPLLIAKNAAFPHWLPDNVSLYFAAERDAQGFYTKIMKFDRNAAADAPPQAMLSGLRITGMQMSSDAGTALLFNGRDARPGSPGTVEVWSIEKNKRTPLNALGELYSPALLPDGSAIVYSQKPTDSHPLLAVCDLDGSAPRVLFPTEDQNDAGAVSYVVHIFPDRDRLLFYGPGSNLIWTMRRDGSNIRHYQLPENVSSPVMVRIDDDSSGATLTVAQASSERVVFQVYRLDFSAKRFSHVDCDSERLVGGHAADPHARRGGTVRLAWLSPGGLAIGQPDKAHYFPLTSTECVSASALQIRQNEPDKAVASALKAHELQPPPEDPGELDRADSRAYLAAKQFERAADAFERATLLYPVGAGAHALQFMFPAASGLPRPAPLEIGAALKEMDQLIAVTPSNRMIPLLRQAFEARSKGDYAAAAETYRQASQICPDEASVGGIRFLEALCAVESSDLIHAGEKWEAAARTADFPQNQYAAGLSAAAYTLDGHPDALARGAAALQLNSAKNGPLAAEFAQLPNSLRGKTWRVHSTSKENAAADNSVKTWVEIDAYTIPFASIAPTRIEENGKYFERHVGVRPVTASAVGLSGSQQSIFHIPCAITIPSISPDKRHLSFAATGEVFPLRPTSCDVFVIDMRGTVVVGNLSVCYTGALASRNTVTALTWNDALELKVTGATIDVFGGETPYTKTVSVPADRVLPAPGH